MKFAVREDVSSALVEFDDVIVQRNATITEKVAALATAARDVRFMISFGVPTGAKRRPAGTSDSRKLLSACAISRLLRSPCRFLEVHPRTGARVMRPARRPLARKSSRPENTA